MLIGFFILAIVCIFLALKNIVPIIRRVDISAHIIGLPLLLIDYLSPISGSAIGMLIKSFIIGIAHFEVLNWGPRLVLQLDAWRELIGRSQVVRTEVLCVGERKNLLIFLLETVGSWDRGLIEGVTLYGLFIDKIGFRK